MKFLLLSIFWGLGPWALAADIDVSSNIPAISPKPGPLGAISNFYEFGLILGTVLAFGAIIYGAVKYTVSSGNPSQQGDAKEWIKQALLGLLLLAGAAFILQTINPGFFGSGTFTIKLPTISPP